MFRRLSRLVALVAIALTAGVSSAGDNDVLYWMVDGNATVTPMGMESSQTISEFFNSLSSEYGPDSAFAARIRVTGDTITEDTFLDLYLPGDGLNIVVGGENGVEFSNVGGYWGAGVPSGNQSPSDTYFTDTPEYSFIVELGNIDSSDNWVTVATGAAATYASLKNSGYIHETFDMNPSSMMVWTPTQFSYIPEPTSGMLTAIGFALLALRRKRRIA